MFKTIKHFLSTCYRDLSPFYRIPIQILPSAWSDTGFKVMLPNPHLAHNAITQLIKENPHVGDCAKQMDGEYLMQVVVEEHSLNQGTLWVNLFPLYTSLATICRQAQALADSLMDIRNVCAAGWEEGVYQYFVNVSHRGFSYEASMKAVKDNRKYTAAYDAADPIQSWKLPLDGIDMERLGFNKHFH